MKNKKYLAVSESGRHTSELRLTTDIKYRWQFYCPTTWAISDLYRYFYSAYCEIRFKLISQLAYEINPDLIIEIASGLSPRGLIMTESYPEITYYDSDLTEIVEFKQTIFKRHNLNQPKNLKLVAKDLRQEKIDFNIQAYYKKIIVITEGLLPWLTQKEAKSLLTKIYKFVQNQMSAQVFWITDINLIFHNLTKNENKINQLIKKERQKLGEKIDQLVISEPFSNAEDFQNIFRLKNKKIFKLEDLREKVSSFQINADLIADQQTGTDILNLIDKKVAIAIAQIV